MQAKLTAEAKERQKRKPVDSVPENLPEQNKGDARDQLGEAFGISGRTAEYGGKVLGGGIPELIAAVDADKIAVSTAASANLTLPNPQCLITHPMRSRR